MLDATAKRAFDLAAASVGLFVLAGPLALIAVAVRLDSAGPIFYRGLRAGYRGRPFRIFKFRTMCTEAEAGSPTTAKNDSRVTRVGHWLRRYKLDELPQLLNVVRGEMSLVGPRPEVLKYAAMYTDDERCILEVRPGITDPASLEYIDLAEVVGEEDPETHYRVHVFPLKNALRVRYVKEQSFGNDCLILARTVSRVLARPFARQVSDARAR